MAPAGFLSSCGTELSTLYDTVPAWRVQNDPVMTHRSYRSRTSAFAAFLALCGAPAWGQATTDADESVEAIWRAQVLDLSYTSSSYYYACDALKAKIGAILRAVGAHKSVKVVMGCKDRSLVKTAFARILVTTPVEATEERIVAATTFTERDHLAARVRGEALPTAADLERFPATWQEVSLSTRAPLRLEANDCDLLRDMSEQLFPKLGIRMQERIRCIDTATHMKPEARVRALVPVSPSVVAEAERSP
jgi:hypothetical protein